MNRIIILSMFVYCEEEISNEIMALKAMKNCPERNLKFMIRS